MTRLDELTDTERKQLLKGQFRPAKARTVVPSGSRRGPVKTPNLPDGTLYHCPRCPEAGSNYAAAERHARTSGHTRIDYTLTKGPSR